MRKYINSIMIFLVSTVLIPLPAYPYEVNTHEAITEEAFNNSVLANGYLTNIGLSSSDKLYQNKDSMQWMIEGSAREDETIPSDFGGEWARYQHHFFDPTNGKGLDAYATVAGTPYYLTGYPAPDWALEEGAVSSYNKQLYSIKDAKSYYLAGLTATDKITRLQNLAKTFRALGQVMHTIQDMAQPQHTRNDSHGGEYLGGVANFGTKSVYETYIDGELGSLPYTPPYTPSFPTIDSYRKFYISGDAKGLADFSNRSFVTEGTNFYCLKENVINGCDGAISRGGYTFPALNKNLKSEVPIEQLNPGTSLTGLVTFYGNVITDAYSNQTFMNNTMSTYSIFDKDLEKRGLAPEFTLNKFNYDSMAGILIPRAVGYSAGLLNYFFRGKMEAKGIETKGLSGATGITIEVKNTTPNEDMSTGTFTVSYRYKALGAKEYTYGSSAEISSGVLIFNAKIPYEYIFSFDDAIPNDATEKQYILVFHGALGYEQGAVVGKIVTLGVWEDWEKGLTGRHPWTTAWWWGDGAFSVVDDIGDNTSNKVLKIASPYMDVALRASLPNSISIPKKVSFDYYVKSFTIDDPGFKQFGLWLSKGNWSCPIEIANSSYTYCDQNGCSFAMERGKWVHVETNKQWKCSSWMTEIESVWITVHGGSDAPTEIYLDNINFE